MVGRALETKKAEHCRERRQPDPSFPKSRWVQPGLVEFEPHREQIRDALMEARDEKSAYGRVGHTLRWGSGIDPIYLLGGDTGRG